jgi:sedoheptulokinase
MFGEVEEKTGLQIRRLVGSGNGIRKNKALQEIARLQFGAELELSPYEEEAACGAAKVHE